VVVFISRKDVLINESLTACWYVGHVLGFPPKCFKCVWKETLSASHKFLKCSRVKNIIYDVQRGRNESTAEIALLVFEEVLTHSYELVCFGLAYAEKNDT